MKQYKARDKITQKMSRDGAIEVNAATGKQKRISKRAREAALLKTPEQQAAQDAQAAQPIPGNPAPDISPNAPPLPHAPGTEAAQDTGATERVLEHIDGAHTRATSKKAARKAQAEAEARAHTSRLQFTEEERATPELQPYIKKSDKAADRLDEARAKIPKEKKLVKERTFDEATGKGKTRLYFEEREKPMNGNKAHKNPLSRPAQEAGIFVHNKVHSVEKDNSGVEGAHKSEETAEKAAKYGARKVKDGYRSHKLKPYRAAAKAEKAAQKANANYLYQKALHDNPQIAASNPFSRYMQNLSEMERIAGEALQSGESLTPTETAYHTAMQAYVAECRGLINQGEYHLPPVPQLKDFDVELAAYKEHVKAEIAQEAADAGMTVEEYAANGYEPYTAPEPEAAQTAEPQEPGEPEAQEKPQKPESPISEKADMPEQAEPTTSEAAQTSTPEPTETTVTYYPINENAARRAKEAISFSDYKPGSATAEYRHYVDEAAEIAARQKKRVDPSFHEKIDGLLDAYARKLAANMNKGYEITARVPSIMIAGGSNFPVRKKEKQNAAADKNMQEFTEIQGLLDKIRSTGMGGISADDPNAVSNRAVYCPDCRKRITRRQTAERMRKMRANVTR